MRNAGPAYPTSVQDRLDPLLQYLLPAASNADCQPPVETGLQVILYDYTYGTSTSTNPSGITRERAAIPEKICINPGCYYYADVDFSTGTVTSDECRDG